MLASLKMGFWAVCCSCFVLLYQPAGPARRPKIRQCEICSMLEVTGEISPGTIKEIGSLNTFFLWLFLCIFNCLKNNMYKAKSKKQILRVPFMASIS